LVVINGIAWDHINVFPTEEIYVDQFIQLLRQLEKAADIVYNETDSLLAQLVVDNSDESHYLHPFKTPTFKVKSGMWEIKLSGKRKSVQVVGAHNMTNIAAAWKVCELLAIEIEDFLRHIATFEGAAIRMQKIVENERLVVFRDYAHAPEKVHATIEAARATYPDWELIACVELHTFSSLDLNYLSRYQNTLKQADHKMVFVNPQQFDKRRLKSFEVDDIKSSFNDNLLIYTQSVEDLQIRIQQVVTDKTVLLLMSSGNFNGLDAQSLVQTITASTKTL